MKTNRLQIWIRSVLGRTTLFAVTTVLLLTSTSSAQSIDDGRKIRFAIEPQPLGAAITDLAVQSGLQISVDADDVRDKTSPGLDGTMTTQMALNQLLADEDLSYRINEDGTVIIYNFRLVKMAEVTVVGEKLDRSFLETATSVAIQDAIAIERNSDQTVQDIFRRVANISGSRNATFSIRGISSAGSGFSSAPLASVFLDGVQTTFNQLGNGVGGTFDTGQVEVLRGPQSTSQGGAALAGAVILKTNDPEFEPETIIEARIAEYETYQLALANTGPLSDDWAYRIVLDYDYTDGFIDNPVRRADNNDFVDTFLGRFKLLYEPADSDLRALLTYNRYEGERGNRTVWDPQNGEFINRNPYKNTTTIDQHAVSLDVSYSVNENLALTSLSTGNWYENVFNENRVIATLPGSLDDTITGVVIDEIFSQEFRLNWTDDRVNGLLGLFYNYKNRGRDQSGSNHGLNPQSFDTDSLFESYSVFADADIRLTDDWTLSVGGRYEEVDSTVTDFLFGVEQTGSEDTFVGKAGLRYTLSASQSLGFTFSQSYRPGGVVALNFDPYLPEFVDNYELSYKGVLADGKLGLNVNVFYLDWTDLQGFVFDENFNFSIENAGDARSYGGEFEITYNPVPRLELFGGVGLAKGTYVEYRSGLGNFDGNEFEDAPQENYVAGFFYKPGKFSFGMNLEYTGSHFADVQNTQVNEERTVVNLTTSYEVNDALTLRLYADNLFDELYQESQAFSRQSIPGGPNDQRTGVFGAPRVIGLEARYRF